MLPRMHPLSTPMTGTKLTMTARLNTNVVLQLKPFPGKRSHLSTTNPRKASSNTINHRNMKQKRRINLGDLFLRRLYQQKLSRGRHERLQYFTLENVASVRLCVRSRCKRAGLASGKLPCKCVLLGVVWAGRRPATAASIDTVHRFHRCRYSKCNRHQRCNMRAGPVETDFDLKSIRSLTSRQLSFRLRTLNAGWQVDVGSKRRKQIRRRIQTDRYKRAESGRLILMRRRNRYTYA